MKKLKVMCFLYSCMIIIALSACQQESTQTTPPTELPILSPLTDDLADDNPVESPLPSLTDDSTDDFPIEWITSADNINMNDMNLYWQHDNIQFAADDNAKLSIYVNAEKNENGDLVFDDGQDWALLMETSLGNYLLFPRQYVQLGGVSCIMYNDYTDNDTIDTISHVLVTVEQTASYQLYDCVFDSDKEAFKVIQIYEAKGINFITDSKHY